MKKLALGLIGFFALSSIAFAKVNINTANESELEALKDVGPVKAKSIIEYRHKHGAFKAIKDLEKVPGIATATFEKIKDQVTIEGASTREKPMNKLGKPATAPEHKDTRN